MVEYIVIKSKNKRKELSTSELQTLTKYDRISRARATKERLGTGFHIYKEIGYTTRRTHTMIFKILFEKVE